MLFRLLGPLEVELDGGCKFGIRAHKPLALLALLLLNANDVVPADRLLESLWDEPRPRSAEKLLQTYVSQLRKALGDDRIVTRSPGYLIRVAPGELDLTQLSTAASPSEALALWRGTPLADFEYDAWAQPEIARLNEARLTALEERIELDLSSGRHADLVGELESLVLAHPLRERLRGQLMLALYRSGRQADALATFREGRQVLVEQLGLEPTRGLQQLERAILRHDANLDVVSQGGGDTQRLIGRASALQDITRLLATSRLVTLVGPGGIGKTRLALEMPNAVLVDLSSLTDAAYVAVEIATTLGVPQRSLHSSLRGKKMLMVLDNFEHVVAAAPLVDDLLAAAHGVSLLVTSRVPLRLTAEALYQVPPLAPADAFSLFVERARASRPEFDPVDIDAIEELCARLDGLPLALELAAARAAVLSPRAILARLGRRLDALKLGSGAAPHRHRTLRATIQWSYELLARDEREEFAALGAFSGSFSGDAADAVVGGEVLEHVTTLVESSLLRQEPPLGDEPRFGMLETIREYARERFDERLDAAELRRRHAAFYCEIAEQAESGLRGSAQISWARRLDADRENLRAVLTGSDSDLAIRVAISLWRYWQVRGSVAEGLAHMERLLARDVGVRRADALAAAGRLAFMHGDLDQAAALLDESLAMNRDALALAVRGAVAQAQDEMQDASQLLDESAAAAQTARDWFTHAVALLARGELLYVSGEFTAARRNLEQGVRAAREAGDTRNIARGLTSLGSVLLEQGDYDRATRLLEEALSIQRELGDLWGIPRSLVSLGVAALGHGDAAEAETLFTRGLTLQLETGDRPGIAASLEQIAALNAADDPERAACLYGAAGILREMVGTHPLQLAPHGRDERLAKVADALDEETFADAWSRGRAMTLEEAVDYTLDNTNRSDHGSHTLR